ncbi:hypothetical protein ACFOET_08195 [Parapedobacter deserti]|uniref:Uncharacterized protein n=1 Tax=Parapedobacter deserti TaxID=1912957 RepID=A0ABV7JHX6_9SPHI
MDNHDKNVELVFQCLDELNDKIKRPPLLPGQGDVDACNYGDDAFI